MRASDRDAGVAPTDLPAHLGGLHKLLDGFPAAAYTCDSAGLITYFNAPAAELWGRAPRLADPEDRFCGSYRLFSAEGSPVSHSRCWMALALQDDRQFLEKEIVVARTDGTRRSVLANVTPIHADDGALIGGVNVLIDMTAQRRSEVALDEKEKQLQAVIDTAVDGILTIDERGLVRSLNPAAVKLFGHDPAEVIGRNIAMLMPEPFKSQLDRYLSGYPATGSKKIIGIGRDVVGLRKDGSTFPMYLAVSETRLTSGPIFTGIVRDISDRIAAEEALRDADQRKDEFIATLGHELRNPLASLQTELDLTRLSNFDPAGVTRSHAVMERQVRYLTRLVDDLLDVSRITHGKFVLRRKRIDLTDVFDAVLGELRGTIDEAGQELGWCVPNEGIPLYADPERLGQVFFNLLSNASKCTPRGGRIDVSARQLEGAVHISVRDTGVGIPEDKLESVFELFDQVERSSELGDRGLGIGLSLVKRLVEMHGGSVAAHSSGPGQGSEFTVWLPSALDEDEGLDPSPPARRSKTHPIGRRRVLLVEDDRDVVGALSRLIRLLGHEIRVAYDGEEAIAVAAEFRPEVVLMDIGLPTLDGYATARRMRAEPWAQHAWLFAVTGWGQEGDRRQAHEAGFDEHLTKPLELGTLRALLARSPRNCETPRSI